MVNFGPVSNEKDKKEAEHIPSSVKFNGPTKNKAAPKTILFQEVKDVEDEETRLKELKYNEDMEGKRPKVTNRPSRIPDLSPAMDRVHNQERIKAEEAAQAAKQAIFDKQKEDRNKMMTAIAANYPMASQHQAPAKPFHTEADTKADNWWVALLKAYPQFGDQEQRVKILLKQLANANLNVVTSWGEDQIVEQRNLVSEAADRIREFNGLNGNELLREVLDYSKEAYAQGSFFKRLASKFSGNSETYNTRVTALRMQVNALLPILDKYNTQCKASGLTMYLAVLSTVDDETKDKDKLLGDAYYNRRMLLNGAMTNMQMLSHQLDQTLEMVTNMLNEISHIMDVVLPAMKMRG
jgi:hypothetical protein